MEEEGSDAALTELADVGVVNAVVVRALEEGEAGVALLLILEVAVDEDEAAIDVRRGDWGMEDTALDPRLRPCDAGDNEVTDVDGGEEGPAFGDPNSDDVELDERSFGEDPLPDSPRKRDRFGV